MGSLELLGHEFTAVTHAIASRWPGLLGRRLRAWYYGTRLKRLGAGAEFYEDIELEAPENIAIGSHFLAMRDCFLCANADGAIEIGDHVSLATNVMINAGQRGLIRIGNDVGIGNNSVLRSSPHAFQDPSRPFRLQGHTPGQIIVDEDVWVAANVVLLPGTHVERGCIIGSGSVVSGIVKAYSIVAGNPGRVVGRRGG